MLSLVRLSRRIVIAGGFAMGASSLLGAQAKDLPVKRSPTPTTGAITVSDLMSRIYQFADDSLQGRLAGSPWAIKGTEYIASELKRLHLQPAGNNGTYFQDVPFGVQAMDSSSTIAANGQTFVAGKDFLASGALGRAPLSQTVEVINGGFALDTTNVLPPDQVRGKLLILRPATTQITNAQAFIATNGYKTYSAMVTAALGVAVVGGPQFSPAAVRNALTPPSFVQLIPDSATTTGGFSLNLTQGTADQLFGGSLANAAKGAAGAPLTLNVKFNVSRRPGRNVVAILPGSDPKLRGEYVAIGAHSDHIGTRSPAVDHDSVRASNTVLRPQGADSRGHPPTADEAALIKKMTDSLHALHGARMDSVFSGADDDGSGSMGVLEIAEAFATAKQRPKRSLLFVWHMGEEEGMLGSRYFTDHPTVPRDSIVTQLNVDMIGRGWTTDITGEGKDGSLLHGRDNGYLQLIGSRRLSTELGDLVERVNTDKKAGFQFDYSLDADGHPQNIYCRSDHYMYARYGIPIVFFTTGGHRDYHQLTDEPEYLNFEQYRNVAQFIHDVAWEVANLDHRPVVDKPKPDPKGNCKQ